MFMSSQESSDDEDELELEKGPDFRDSRVKVASLRLDSMAKLGFNMSRRLVCCRCRAKWSSSRLE